MSRILSRFHWQVAGVAFVLYALTLSHGVTLTSLPLAAKVTGWDWLPVASRPLTWLLTLPLHLLPAGWIPSALNLFSAGLAALTLGLLARSVELLPWHSPPPPGRVWLARLPVLLACAVCGLEFNFWQEATAATGEMTDLFLFALALRCLLEYRAENEMRWLNLAAVTWGLGMAENWLMLVGIPLFIAALIALRRMRFFQKDFLLRMLGLGLAGFSIYALLPLVNGLNPHSPWGFGEAWLATLRATKAVFHTLYYPFWSWHRLLTCAVLLYFLVPVLPCFLRLNDETTENKSGVDIFQIWLFRALRVVLVLACLWLVFDPEVGPRQIVRQQLGVALPLVTFDYVNAIGGAFLAGSLLFVSQIRPLRRSRSAFEKFVSALRQNAPRLLAAGTAALVLALLARNLPPILAVNREPLAGYGELLARSLPPGGGIVLADDATKLAVLQAALAKESEGDRWQAANLKLLVSAKYRAALERTSPRGWLAAGAGDLKLNELLHLLDSMAQTNRLFFVEPHNGMFVFELFQPQPLAAVSELKTYEDRFLLRPQLPAERIAANEKFWDAAWSGGLEKMSDPPARLSSVWKFLHNRLALSPAARDQSRQLRAWYSAAFNDWGVALQRQGNLEAARRRFLAAQALNTNNLAVAVNLVCNSNLLAGKTSGMAGAGRVAEKFRNIQQLAGAMKTYGEFDDPAIGCVLGGACLSAGWPRQAWAEFERARVLSPEAITPDLMLAQIYSRLRFDGEVFAAINRLRPKAADSTNRKGLEMEMAVLEARSWLSQTNPTAAAKVLEALRQKYTDDIQVTELVFKTYLAFGGASNALQVVDAQLAQNPDSVPALNNRAALLIQMQKPAAAIPALDRALSLTNLPSIRLNRAIAQLQLGNFAAAETDYAQLENSPADAFSVQFGLSQVALHNGDTNAAIRRLERCLTNAPSQSARWNEASARLDALKNSAAQ